MTLPFTELLNRYRSIELSYNTCAITDAAKLRDAHTKVMDEIVERQLVPMTPSENLEALRQAKIEMSDNGSDLDWTVSLAGCFLNGALTYAENIDAELPVQRVDRLSTELAHALDAWRQDTNIPFIAHVHPASSRKGFWYENASIGAMMAEQMAGVSSELANLIAAYDAANAELRKIENSDGFDEAEAEFEAKEAAELKVVLFPCQTLEDVRAKARLALSDENVFDSLANCNIDGEHELMAFLRSLLGEGAE